MPLVAGDKVVSNKASVWGARRQPPTPSPIRPPAAVPLLRPLAEVSEGAEVEAAEAAALEAPQHRSRGNATARRHRDQKEDLDVFLPSPPRPLKVAAPPLGGLAATGDWSHETTRSPLRTSFLEEGYNPGDLRARNPYQPSYQSRCKQSPRKLTSLSLAPAPVGTGDPSAEFGSKKLPLPLGPEATDAKSWQSLQDALSYYIQSESPPSGKARGLWAMATPGLPPSTFAEKVYGRRRIPLRLDLGDLRGPPNGLEDKVEKQLLQNYETVGDNFQAGGSASSSSPGRLQLGASAPQSARVTSRPSVPFLKAMQRPVSGTVRKLVVEGPKLHPEGNQVIIGATTLKLSPSSSKLTVLIELEETRGRDLKGSRDKASSASRPSLLSPRATEVARSPSPMKDAGSESPKKSPLARSGSQRFVRQNSSNLSPERDRAPAVRRSISKTMHLEVPEVASSERGASEGDCLSPRRSPRGSLKGEEDVSRSSPHQDLRGERAEDVNSPTNGGAAPRKDHEEIWLDVFKKLQEHKEVHRDDLPRALTLSGFVAPRPEWVDQVFSSITQFSTLETEEYLRFMRQYQRKQHQAYTVAFAKCDADGSGFVEAGELADLLRSFGIEPLAHVLEEVIMEVDEDGRGTLDEGEFKELMDLLLSREGFTKMEFEDFMAIYRRFDRDRSGEIDTKELAVILNWLGYSCDPIMLAGVVAEVDVDGSGTIDEREFLMCMRKVRERELQIVSESMKLADKDGSGTVSQDEVDFVLKALGYELINPKAVIEAAASAAESGRESAAMLLRMSQGNLAELGLGDLWQLLMVYRKKEGFCNVDVKSINHSFLTYDKDRSGELNILEAPRALRDLGYKAGFEVMQSILSKVDVDDTGSLDQMEFRKMVRMFQERELLTFKEAFKQFDQDNNKELPQAVALEAIESLGFKIDQKAQKAFFKVKELTRSSDGLTYCVRQPGFIRAGLRFSQSKREVYRRNGGWSDEEVLEFDAIFKRYDVKKTGEVSNKELVRLVEDLFPDISTERSMRPQLLELMREVDQNGSGSLDFADFLRLMQLVREFQDRERVVKENAAIKETGFSTQEVAEFRELFLRGDTNSAPDENVGELSFEEFRKMIHMITPLGDALTMELSKIFDQVRSTLFGKEPKSLRHEADFPEFLLLMKHLLEINFANIKEKTSG